MSAARPQPAAALGASAAAPARPVARRSLIWLQGLACGALATLATPAAVLLAVLLAPGLVFLVCDREPGKPVARTVLLFGVAASVMPLRTLWLAPMSIAEATHLLSDISVTGTAWGAAAGAWLLGEVAPLLTNLVLDYQGRARTKILQADRTRLETEWALPPRP